MNNLGGLGKQDRAVLGRLIRGSPGIISVSNATKILGIKSSRAAQILSSLCKRGWLARVRRGAYVPVGLASTTTEPMLEEPWVVASQLFEPCYIAGWSAAEYWNFTEQIFSSVFVCTTNKVHKRKIDVVGTRFELKTVSKERFFGTQSVWINSKKVEISAPTKTVVDLLNDPAMGGGIRTVTDIFESYLKSEKKNLSELLDFSSKMKNSTIFKRLGFLTERIAPENREVIEACKRKIKSGYSYLDTSIKKNELATEWGLWVPIGWKKSLGL